MIPQAKQMIAAAMKKLMRRKAVGQIRVVEICREADVGRQSFYYHFQDKHDLLAWMFLQTMGDLDIVSIADVTAVLIRMKQDYVFFSRAYEDTSQTPFWEYMLEYYVNSFTARALDCLGGDELDEPTRFLIRFYCYGGVNITREWLSGSAMSAEELVRLYYLSMPKQLQDIYQIDISTLPES